MVLVETGLLVLLLRALGEMQAKGVFTQSGNALPLQGGLEIGAQAPPFEVMHPEGRIVRLEDIQGSRLLLAFLSPGCSACAEAIRTFNKIQEKERDLTILMFGSTNQETNRQYATEHESKLPLLTVVHQSLFNEYQIPGFPFAFILDKARTIQAKGFASYQEQVLLMLAEADKSSSVNAHIVLTS